MLISAGTSEEGRNLGRVNFTCCPAPCRYIDIYRGENVLVLQTLGKSYHGLIEGRLATCNREQHIIAAFFDSHDDDGCTSQSSRSRKSLNFAASAISPIEAHHEGNVAVGGSGTFLPSAEKLSDTKLFKI